MWAHIFARVVQLILYLHRLRGWRPLCMAVRPQAKARGCRLELHPRLYTGSVSVMTLPLRWHMWQLWCYINELSHYFYLLYIKTVSWECCVWLVGVEHSWNEVQHPTDERAGSVRRHAGDSVHPQQGADSGDGNYCTLITHGHLSEPRRWYGHRRSVDASAYTVRTFIRTQPVRFSNSFSFPIQDSGI